MEIGVLIKRRSSSIGACKLHKSGVICIGDDWKEANDKLSLIGIGDNVIELRQKEIVGANYYNNGTIDKVGEYDYTKRNVAEIIIKSTLSNEHSAYVSIDTGLISTIATKDEVKNWMAKTYGLYSIIKDGSSLEDKECWNIAHSYISELSQRVTIDNNGYIHVM